MRLLQEHMEHTGPLGDRGECLSFGSDLASYEFASLYIFPFMSSAGFAEFTWLNLFNFPAGASVHRFQCVYYPDHRQQAGGPARGR